MQKQLKEPRSILMSSADELPISMGNSYYQLLWAIHTRFQRSINTKVIKPSNPFTNVYWVSVFNNIFCAATNFGCIDSFLLPNSGNENDGWWFPWSYAAGLFWTVNVCWAHPVISRASAVAVHFSWCYSRCFWSSQNRMCRKLNKP